MKMRSVKFYLILLAVAVIGIAIVGTYVVASGTLISREASESYAISEGITKLQFETTRAQVSYFMTKELPRLEVYAKAWLPEPIDFSERLVINVEGTTLTVKEVPFESTFLGLFPQPYEMSITAFVPEAVYQSIMGGQP